MIGMMNAGTVDVPAEFYGEGRPRSERGTGKKGATQSRLFTKKQMLHEKISYAKDGRMLVNGRLAASSEVLSPSEMWENLMMRVMCRAVCESYMKAPPPPKKRILDYLPWRKRARNGTAAVNAIANAATAVSELQRTRRDSASSIKSLKVLSKNATIDTKSTHKSSTESGNSKEIEPSKENGKRSGKNSGGNMSASSPDNSLPLRTDGATNKITNVTCNGKSANRQSFVSSSGNINNGNSNLNNGKANGSSFNFLKSPTVFKSANSTDDVINSLAAKISAKITRNPITTTTAAATTTSSSLTTIPQVTRSSSLASLKSSNAIAKPTTSPSSTRQPLSISALTSLTTRKIPRSAPQVPTPGTTPLSFHSQKSQLNARRPLHALSTNSSTSSSISSRLFGIGTERR